ncbi:hypothetical protein AVEN_14861-1, partial [Araneus ventricosus]
KRGFKGDLDLLRKVSDNICRGKNTGGGCMKKYGSRATPDYQLVTHITAQSSLVYIWFSLVLLTSRFEATQSHFGADLIMFNRGPDGKDNT